MADDLRELWRFRYLLRMLVARELKVRYKNSVLGFAWSIVPPALSVVVLTFLMRGVLQRDMPNYSAYLLCGIIAWNFFSIAVLDSSQSLLVNYGVIKKIYMPREVIPIAIVISNFVHFLLGWAVYFVTFFGILPGAVRLHLLDHGGTPLLSSIVWFPLIVAAEFLLVLGCSLWSAALNMFYEDVKFILQTLFSLVYFVFPILVTADVIGYSGPMVQHPWLFKLYMLNPVTAMITGFRNCLLQPAPPEWFTDKLKGKPAIDVEWWIYLGAFAISVFVAWSGYAYFNSRKWKFVERS
ncbi:MAG TPA: ABC transporter permease [Chthonomonadaceae bacterium]|nr:ABC transporter permease [Chthonomonadaceae bacterium]